MEYTRKIAAVIVARDGDRGPFYIRYILIDYDVVQVSLLSLCLLLLTGVVMMIEHSLS